ncbi:MAG: histidine phosphatase family protein [Firmicutes bacterium]|nr:histidine phosphatase family protein [Bacillota bacterium]
MKKEIYLIRHAEPLKSNNTNNIDSLQLQNEKWPLTVSGEQKAKELSEKEELQNIDLVISSNYVRTISTAKYIADKNNTNINIIEDFNERKFGINDWSELPEDFGQKQFLDEDFKTPNGESRKEVTDRMYNGLINILNNNQCKKVVITSHATAITFLLMKLGEYKNNAIYFNNKLIMDSSYKWKAPDVFKLTYEDNELIDIENIK